MEERDSSPHRFSKMLVVHDKGDRSQIRFDRSGRYRA